MNWIIALPLLIGINTAIWGTIGLIRFISERIWKKDNKLYPGVPLTPISEREVAAIIPAHNEELTIKGTIKALLRVLPKENIYLANDNSEDQTSALAKETGITVYDIYPNAGKARALVQAFKKFDLLARYKAILLNDADIEIDENYLKRALPLLHRQDVACVAGHQVQKPRKNSILDNYFLLYRSRLWLTVQLGMRYGQTWKHTNVSYIIPGALSIYKTKVLQKIDIDAPNLIIEDFNMTFELQKKHLGKIEYSTTIKGYHQDPYTFHDYVRQMRRWYLGFWQTVRRNGLWMSMFWISTGEIIFQLLVYSMLILSIPLTLLVILFNFFSGDSSAAASTFNSLTLGIAILLILDYTGTVFTAIYTRRPVILLYGLGFFFLLFVDAFIYVSAIPLAFKTTSDGIWVSPKRKAFI